MCSGDLIVDPEPLFDTRFGIPALHHVAECTFCGVAQLAYPPDLSELKSLYATYYNFGGESHSLYFRLREWFFDSALYRLWMILDGDISFHSVIGKGRLLDVGCNEGRGLTLYRKNGFDVSGLELNPVAAEQARKRGFEVSSNTIEQHKSNHPFDVIVMSNVLEHVPNPRASISAASLLLKEGGELWLSCPNYRSWLRKLFGRYWINWHIPFHLTFFDTEGLSRLLGSMGFELLQVKTRTPAIWFGFSMIAFFFSKPKHQNRQLRNPLIVLLTMLVARTLFFPVLWLFDLAGRGDCLLIRAKKIPCSNPA